MKEFLLRSLFACNELNVIKQQDISSAISSAKSLRLIVTIPNGIDKLVHELLERKIFNSQVRRLLSDQVPYCLSQVSLSQADTAVKVKWVVRSSGTVGYSLRRGIRKLIAGGN